MALTGINATPYDLSALTAQISNSVRNIKAKATVVPQNVGSLDNGAGTYTAQPFSLNSYAVSYLEPFSLYSVQKIVSEAAEEIPEQNRRQLRPDGETAEKKAAESAHYIGGFGFAEELAQVASAADYAKAAAVYGQRFSIDVPESKLVVWRKCQFRKSGQLCRPGLSYGCRIKSGERTPD
ncbi:MAG: hypothetical protein V8R23_06900 [Alphaproteobacteria bacterium]